MPIGIQDFNIQDATVRITNWRNLRRIDPVLPLVTLALVLVGWALLYSASRSTDIYFLHRQMLAFFVGVGLACAVIATDYRYLVALGPAMYVLCIAVLVGTIFFGHESKGAERWISILGVRVQPSEFSKIMMVYFLTWYLSTLGDRIRRLHWFVLAFMLTAVPVALILKQPNLGTAATLFPLTFVMLFVAGCRLWHLGLVVLAGLSLVPLVWIQIKDFDPRLRVISADANKDEQVTYEEFGAHFGIQSIPEAVTQTLQESDIVEVPRRRDCKVVLMGYMSDGTRVVRGAPVSEAEWLPLLERMREEGCEEVGLLYNPEFHGMAVLDTNQDGMVSEAEFLALDKNGDGIITSDDKGMFELHHHQKARIYTYLHPEFDPQGSSWQTLQSKISVGSGGLSGKGFMNGTQTRLNYLPEHHTDFIFSVLAEEMGFVGVVTVIGLFLLFLLRGLWFARDTPEMMGSLLATGVVTVLGFHVFVNVAITVGLLPVTGIPLPFLSYGRSFYLTTMVCVGILLNVPMRRNIFVNS